MMYKRISRGALLIVIALVSCTGSLKKNDLLGEWRYVKVESPKNIPPDSVSSAELKEMSPSISFSSAGDLKIMWGGRQLSAGKFVLDGNMIRYTENLAEGKTRQFPFIVRKITDHELVFETMVQQFSRVTAVKVN